jgi:hypothetical protein
MRCNNQGAPVISVPLSIDATEAMLSAQSYVCGRPLATVTFLALKLGRPLFLEGASADPPAML